MAWMCGVCLTLQPSILPIIFLNTLWLRQNMVKLKLRIVFKREFFPPKQYLMKICIVNYFCSGNNEHCSIRSVNVQQSNRKTCWNIKAANVYFQVVKFYLVLEQRLLGLQRRQEPPAVSHSYTWLTSPLASDLKFGQPLRHTTHLWKVNV